MGKKSKAHCEPRDQQFYSITVDDDTWAKIACRAKTSDLCLHVSPYDVMQAGDIILFGCESNPYPKCVCKVLKAKWFPGFRSAFKSAKKPGLGYIMGEAISASWHDFADNYTLNQVRSNGVCLLIFTLLSCEYMKYTDETDPEKVKPRTEDEFDPEFDYFDAQQSEQEVEEEEPGELEGGESEEPEPEVEVKVEEPVSGAGDGEVLVADAQPKESTDSVSGEVVEPEVQPDAGAPAESSSAESLAEDDPTESEGEENGPTVDGAIA